MNSLNINFIFTRILLLNFGNGTYRSIFVCFIFQFFNVFELLNLICIDTFIILIFRWCILLSVDVWLILNSFLNVAFLNLFSFNINFPIFNCTFLRTIKIEIKYKTFLNSNIQINILLSTELWVVILLHKNKPLW